VQPAEERKLVGRVAKQRYERAIFLREGHELLLIERHFDDGDEFIGRRFRRKKSIELSDATKIARAADSRAGAQGPGPSRIGLSRKSTPRIPADIGGRCFPATLVPCLRFKNSLF
jgi:hypothetical protein